MSSLIFDIFLKDSQMKSVYFIHLELFVITL